MKFRCRNCGYIFKSDSETICPECLAARDEEDNGGQESAEFSSGSQYKSNSYQPSYRGGYNHQNDNSGGRGFVKLNKPTKLVMALVVVIAVIGFIIPIMSIAGNMARMKPEPEYSLSEAETPVNDSYEDNDYDYEFSTYDNYLSFGESCEINGLEVSFSKPRELAVYPELYALPEETGMKVLAVDIRIQNNKPEGYKSYEYFAAYSTALQDMDLAAGGAYEVGYTWSAISFNGLMENQIPDNIEVFRGSDLKYTMYFLVSQECENPRLIYTDYTFINDEMTETRFIFS